MKRILIRWLFCALLALMVMGTGLAEFSVSAAQNVHTYAILLPEDDGFQSLTVAGEAPVTDVLDIYISVLEDQGHQVRLLGATTNNNISSLTYRTGTEGIDWKKLPQKGNEATLSSTIGELIKKDYDDYDRIVVISGRLNARKISFNNKRVQTGFPTWLVQTVPFADGTLLHENYAKITGGALSDKAGTDEAGFDTYVYTPANVNAAVELKYSQMDPYKADTLLDQLLLGTVFDGAYDVRDGVFQIPGTIVDHTMLLIAGDDLSGVQLVSPEGNSYPVQEQTKGFRVMKLGDQQVALISLDSDFADGRWNISGNENIRSGKFYYSLKDNYNELVRDVPVVPVEMTQGQIVKGEKGFEIADNDVTQDLLRLHSDARLKITDVFAGEKIAEEVSNEKDPNHVSLLFQRGGEHTLTFSLLSGEKELLKQTATVSVEDQPIQFLQKQDAEQLILFDTYEKQLWQVNAKNWFYDPDGDPITLTLVGGNTNTIRLDGEILSFQAREGELDGSEKVTLQARSDTAETIGTVRLVWRSLAREMNNLLASGTIEPEEESGLVKRGKVRMYASFSIQGEDRERILELLRTCEADVLDADGQVIVSARFDSEQERFESGVFELPDVSGNDFFWILRLKSAVNALPEWSIQVKSEKVKTENHPPEGHPELMENSHFGEQYVFSMDDWMLNITEGLITDPDGDEVNYHVMIDSREISNGKTIEPIKLPQFGKYEITIQGTDNEGTACISALNYSVTLIDLKERLEEVQSSITVEPVMDVYGKRNEGKLSLSFEDKDWTDAQRMSIANWFEKCEAYVTVNGEKLKDADVQYSKDDMTFRAKVNWLENAGDYTYQFILEDGEEQQADVLLHTAAKVISIGNHNPIPNEEKELTSTVSEWVMDASTYDGIIVPVDMIVDPDGDQMIRKLKMTNAEGKTILEQEDHNEGDYVLRFEAIPFFTMSQEYDAEISYTDNDHQTYQHTMHIELKNKKLLIAIIIVAAIIFLTILAIILYALYRKNLPAFAGEVYFADENGNKVSSEISLLSWGKEKHLPLTIFAGTIWKLLSDPQWEAMKNLELRPDKTEGFTLHDRKDTKKTEGRELPYEIGEGLKINKHEQRQTR